jgi:secreted PhoX family phosphatase
MEWFGLDADGKRVHDSATERGLLAINHEATTDEKLSSFFLHANGGTSTLPRPASEVDKETAIHGVLRRRSGQDRRQVGHGAWLGLQLPPDGAERHRDAGPARGNALMVTKYSPTGTATRGTLNNCGTGKTPWGSFLTGEENWFGYFTRGATDDAARGNDKSVTSLKRYGRSQGAASRHGWETGGTDDKYAALEQQQDRRRADGSDDYRNELNGMGYIVEIDAYDKTRIAKKRTALGRYAHESAAFSKAGGRPAAGGLHG